MRVKWSRVGKEAEPTIETGAAPTPTTASRLMACPVAQAIKETASARSEPAAGGDLVFRHTNPKGKHGGRLPLVSRAGVQATVGGGLADNVSTEKLPAMQRLLSSSRNVTRTIHQLPS
jgi:hypothetical protein